VHGHKEHETKVNTSRAKPGRWSRWSAGAVRGDFAGFDGVFVHDIKIGLRSNDDCEPVSEIAATRHPPGGR